MKDDVRNAFMQFTASYEGIVPWMYLDLHQRFDLATKSFVLDPLVTVAIGNLIDPLSYAQDLPFLRTDGSPATRSEIHACWDAVKSHPELAVHGHRAYELLTPLRLSREGIEKVVMAKFEQNERALATRFANWHDWPADAQLGAHSCAWAAGSAWKAPKFDAACALLLFDEAADECWLNDDHNPGLRPRNNANVVLFRNAAKVVRYEMSRDVLHFPATLMPQVEISGDGEHDA